MKYLAILLLIFTFSCRKHEEVLLQNCRLKAEYVDGKLSKKIEYNAFGNIQKVIYFYNDKINDTFLYEYDNQQQLLGHKSVFAPNTNKSILKYESGKLSAFEIINYDDSTNGTIEMTADNKIKQIIVTSGVYKNTSMLFEYYPDGNLLRSTKSIVYADKTSVSFVHTFSNYDNTPSPLQTPQLFFHSLEAGYSSTLYFKPISPNNAQKIDLQITTWSTFPESYSIFVDYNKYKYPSKTTSIHKYGSWEEATETEYEYENCK